MVGLFFLRKALQEAAVGGNEDAVTLQKLFEISKLTFSAVASVCLAASVDAEIRSILLKGQKNGHWRE